MVRASFILTSIQAHFIFFLLDISQWLDNLHFKLDLIIFDILLDKEEKEAKLIISETRLENCVLYVFHFTKESTSNNFFSTILLSLLLFFFSFYHGACLIKYQKLFLVHKLLFLETNGIFIKVRLSICPTQVSSYK